MAERSKALDWKSSNIFTGIPGFESLPLRHPSVLKRLEADIFPAIGSVPLSGIPTPAFRDAVRQVERRGALDIAKRVQQNCGQVMRYA